MPTQLDKYFVTAAIKLALIEDDNVNEENIKTQNYNLSFNNWMF